ncbi:MAG: Holliday junction resolvase RuvX [Rhodocyclaceae bacterium]|nr:Holliday junction resolvase RuvX [Rhodocyclaceae bacterium]
MLDQGTEGGTVMAFDFGLKRIGVAIGETLIASARPLAIIEDEINDRRFAAIGKLIAEWQPARLVVGLPRHVDGSDHAFAARCDRFARQLSGRFGLPVEFVDERFSSCAATSQLADQGAGRRARVDAAAAAIILQDWFDQHAHPTQHH